MYQEYGDCDTLCEPQLRCDAEHVRELLPSLDASADSLQDRDGGREGGREGGVREGRRVQLIDARGKVQYQGLEVRAARGGVRFYLCMCICVCVFVCVCVCVSVCTCVYQTLIDLDSGYVAALCVFFFLPFFPIFF